MPRAATPPGSTEAAVARGAAGLTGEIDQVPPMYSAVRVDGRRLHEAARAGEEVERAPRRVVVHALDAHGLRARRRPTACARARVTVRCGKGTYVRTLAADLGTALGVPAHLAALRRTEAGPFSLGQACRSTELEALAAQRRRPGWRRARPPGRRPRRLSLPFPVVGGRGPAGLAQGKALTAAGPDGLRRVIGRGAATWWRSARPTEAGELRPIRVVVQPARNRRGGPACVDSRRR